MTDNEKKKLKKNSLNEHSLNLDNSDNKNRFFQIKYSENDPNSLLWHKKPKNFSESNPVLLYGFFEKVGRNFNVKIKRCYFITDNNLYYKKVIFLNWICCLLSHLKES